MKKEVNKIILTLGFITSMVGLWYNAINGNLNRVVYAFEVSMLAAVLAIAFIFASNTTLKNLGYGLTALLGATGIRSIILMDGNIYIGLLIPAIGFIIMSLSGILYLFALLFKFFGFVKKNDQQNCLVSSGLLNELARYKEMQDDKVLTEEEFSELKQRAMENTDNKISSVEDLKKWKKLLDQQIITEEEFANIKKNIFAK